LETRPKIKIELSQLDKILEQTSYVLLLVMWAFNIYTFLKLPNIIPIHFNGSGGVDRYGNKLILFSLPVLATAIFFLLTQLNKYPYILNYIKPITEENAVVQYSIATRMLRFLKLAILVIFILVNLFTYLTTVGITNGLGIWFLPLTFALLLIPTIISISKSLK